ncbi:MAG TPA: restriction endonuclease, partial [Candidatus Limnocylindrales bacterium]
MTGGAGSSTPCHTVVGARRATHVLLEVIERQALFAVLATRYVQRVAPVQAKYGFVPPSDAPARMQLTNARDRLLAELSAMRELLVNAEVLGPTAGDRLAYLIVSRHRAVADFNAARSRWFDAECHYFVDCVAKALGPTEMGRDLRAHAQGDLDLLLEWQRHQTRLAQEDAGGSGSSVGGPAWHQAEELAAQYLRRQGFRDAATTPAGTDMGLDVVGRGIVAQVKYHAGAVGRPELQRLVGANPNGSTMAFFSRAGYPATATEYAQTAGIALFTIELPATVAPVNQRAREIGASAARL